MRILTILWLIWPTRKKICGSGRTSCVGMQENRLIPRAFGSVLKLCQPAIRVHFFHGPTQRPFKNNPTCFDTMSLYVCTFMHVSYSLTCRRRVIPCSKAVALLTLSRKNIIRGAGTEAFIRRKYGTMNATQAAYCCCCHDLLEWADLIQQST